MKAGIGSQDYDSLNKNHKKITTFFVRRERLLVLYSELELKGKYSHNYIHRVITVTL